MDTLFSGKSTLILDKQLEDLQSLRSILGSLGFGEVQVASSVNMALSMLREQPVDVCFLCYELGRNEKNGLQLLLELQAESSRLYTSCYVLVIEPEKSELLLGSPENAPDIYISKPYDKIRLGQRLEKLVRLKQSVRPVERLLDQGAWQEAIDECERHEKLYPGLRVYLQRLKGVTLLRRNEPERALTIFAELLEGRDQPWIRIGLAIAACRAGWFDRAREQLDQVIAQQQICVEAFTWRARLHRLEGAWSEAQGLLRRAVVLQPTVAVLQGDLGNLAAMNGDTGLAIDAFRAAIRYSRYSAFQHPDYYFGLVRMLMQRMSKKDGDASREAVEESIRMLEQAQRDFLDVPVIHFRARLIASEVYRAVGDQPLGDQAANEALHLFRELTLDEQAMWLDQLIEGVEQTAAAERARAGRQELTRQMAQLQWGRANLRGMMQYRNGELSEAYESFAGAWQQQPDNASIGLNLVQTALELARRGQALSRDRLALCDETLYRIQYASLTPKQQQRYMGLAQRLAEYVKSL
jgi:predicted Zn-dependent protease/CheY-like chemotaxis protein